MKREMHWRCDGFATTYATKLFFCSQPRGLSLKHANIQDEWQLNKYAIIIIFSSCRSSSNDTNCSSSDRNRKQTGMSVV